MPDLSVINAALVLPDRIVPDAELHVRDGRIAALGPAGSLPAWTGGRVDAGGRLLAPGFVDLHVHGGDGADFMDGDPTAFETALGAHLRHGTTAPLPTGTVAAHEQILAFLRLARRFRDEGRTPGAHLYGPFFAPEKVGCHPRSPARPPTAAETAEYLAFADVIRNATCAPELPGATEFYRAAAAAGIRLNAGHSNASWSEMAAAYAAGVRHVDHFYCAMSSVPGLRARLGAPMQASMAEFVLAHADVTTEVIADGRHLAPDLLAFVLRMKGPDAVALVTDCNRALDLPPGDYVFGPREGGEPFYSDGTVGLTPDRTSLASSIRGMDFMVRHMHRAVGADIPAAVRMATLTPARIAGIDADYGSLAVGKRADLILLDAELRVRRVWRAGADAGAETIPPRLREAYRRTRYVVDRPGGGTVDIRIGGRLPEIDALAGGRSWAFVTAENPRSQPQSESSNAAARDRLTSRIAERGLPRLTGRGVGDDPAWKPEQSLLVWGIDRDSAADLGAEFGQFAVVFGEGGGPAELLPCLPWS
jgi:N-acetylglucosamine-6-phosphate deacetylase